jgi:hypothetical protein
LTTTGYQVTHANGEAIAALRKDGKPRMVNHGLEASHDQAWFSGLLLPQQRTNLAAPPKTAATEIRRS